MKYFETPEIKILRFSIEDILTASNDLPFVPFSVRTEDELELAEIGKP